MGDSLLIHEFTYLLLLISMKNWQGIPTTLLTLGGKVMVPRDDSTLVISTELLNYIIAFVTQGKSGHYKHLTVDLLVACLLR